MSGKTLVFGVSLKPERYSNMAVNKLRKHNHKVVAFGMVSGNILDINVVSELVMYANIDTITLYMNSKRQEIYYDYLVGLNPKRVIFNPGTENLEFYKVLNKHGIAYEESCTLVLLSTSQF